MKQDRKDHINHSCETGSQLFNHNVENIFSRRSRKMWHVSSSDGWHLPPARELDGWPTGYIRKTALELRSSPSLWFLRLNTWWVFSSHDVLPLLNSVVESFYVSVRVNFPLAGVWIFCAVTSLSVVFVKHTRTAEEVKNWRILYVKEYSLNVFRFRCYSRKKHLSFQS